MASSWSPGFKKASNALIEMWMLSSKVLRELNSLLSNLQSIIPVQQKIDVQILTCCCSLMRLSAVFFQDEAARRENRHQKNPKVQTHEKWWYKQQQQQQQTNLIIKGSTQQPFVFFVGFFVVIVMIKNDLKRSEEHYGSALHSLDKNKKALYLVVMRKDLVIMRSGSLNYEIKGRKRERL